ncbi:MAG TPA: hypothetical protein DEB25_02540 [Desulfobulbaceae bacterium]|nr:hypothetical protein [Desulfobulbaceae bacterium]
MRAGLESILPTAPLRTCVICRTRTDKRLLARFTWRDGQAVADDGRQMDGRGVYVCRRGVCLNMLHRWPERWPRWFRWRGKEGAGVKNKQDVAARRDGGAA